MKIGELSRLTGVSIRSIRYYEQQGLIASGRSEKGYRLYHSLHIDQLNTIKFYLSLGLTTEQIASFLHCVLQNKEAFCRQVLPIYEQKLLELDSQIEQLLLIRSNLAERIRSIRNETEADRHVIEASER
ncbi:MerR family transcriptional regulator [Paenibacillus silviterrae]|uniref:MerR family transcriptional regulator n=1 Tax=Paenibacillus silviterrae TaxID=3242194 RepID=UPI002542F3C9|nr:MerR family transcriptional regulator [Paenibacillus chinjuensis]